MEGGRWASMKMSLMHASMFSGRSGVKSVALVASSDKRRDIFEISVSALT